MSVTINVLALNDDNHETSFHSSWENKCYYNHMAFIRELAKPHHCLYNVRCIHLLNIDENNETALEAFNVIQSGKDGKNMSYQFAFTILWNISTKNMFE